MGYESRKVFFTRPASNVSAVCRSLFEGEPEIRLIKLLLRDRGNAIDVGANIGVYTYFMSRHASQVFSFEPDAGPATQLEGRFKNARVFPLAISDIAGDDFLHVPIVNGIAVHEAATLTGRLPRHDDIQQQHIRKVRLDDLGLEGIELIKIDVEQHERQVIQGVTWGSIMAQAGLRLGGRLPSGDQIEQTINQLFRKIS